MKSRIALSLAALSAAAGPAMAHNGAHVHPHGAETWIALAVVAVIAAGCVSLLRGRK